MFRFFRKHNWILIVALSLTVISFLFFFSPSQRMSGSGARNSDELGSIYGQKVTPDAFTGARNEIYLFHLFNYGNWPDKDPNFSRENLERQIYARLMLIQKANDLGIHVGDDAAVTSANEILHSPELVRALRINGESVPLDAFVKQILQPEGLGAADFENFTRHNLAIGQLEQTMGLTGDLVTPQEAAMAYRRERQELSAQIVFFSASNYLSQVAVTPDAVAQFYTNYLAEYRLPDRVQVNYVEFNITNFLAQSKAEWAKTNFDEIVEASYRQLPANYFPDAKTPADAKLKIRDVLIRQRALADAHAKADEFANAVFNLDPARPENLAAVAKQRGLAVHVTAPFDSQYGPVEFTAPEGFAKIAFGLSPDEPFSSPIVGPDGVYVIAFARQLPSEIPPFEQIHERVTQDFQLHAATLLAQQAGTNFVFTLKIRMAAGSSFASSCLAAGLKPEILPPFSLSTKELPELAARAELNRLKQAAFTTPVGRASDFQETDDGGFIVFVQSQLPVDETKMDSDLPQFTATLRRSRENEAFNQWLGTELHKEFGQMKIFQQQ
ncbi:MAG TPA: peptidylprolyl isomerase [Candidatus Dormibacteraeota bacterium]|nr:peptidylprolyl isomerase [Candidatus Dormibacteraeota bacterium]